VSVLVIGLAGSTLRAASESPEAIYWQQQFLFVPYQMNTLDPAASRFAEVHLLLSRTGIGDWTVLQSARPDVQGFSYNAPEDGHYWLAVRHQDAQGQPLGLAVPAPQLHIVVDTEKPSLQLAATRGLDGEVTVQYQASDANLQPSSLILEARTSPGLWEKLNAVGDDGSTSSKLVGKAQYSTATSGNLVEVRASVSDLAGHRTEAAATANPQGTSSTSVSPPPTNAAYPFALPSVNKDPQQVVQTAPPQQRLAQDWPATNQLPATNHSPSSAESGPSTTGAQAIRNPYLNASIPLSAPKLLQAEVQTHTSGGAMGTQSLPQGGQPLEAPQPSQWSSTASSTGDQLLVDSRTFDLEYDLQSVGPDGVAKVELWGMQEGGANWQSLAVDPDNRSPIRVTVPAAGEYGFRILVTGVNGASVAPPRSGDKPELVVRVNLQPPTARLRGVRPVAAEPTVQTQ
jgi:hypothetical protein